MTDPRQRRAQAAAKKRRQRARLADGSAMLSVPVADLNALIEVLLDLGWLDAAVSEDRHHIGISVGKILDDLVNGRPRGTDKIPVRGYFLSHE